MHPPNFYTDDEWNELTDDERRQSLSQEYDEDRLEEIAKDLEQQIKDFGQVRGSDDYNELRNLEREYQTYLDLLNEARRS